MDLGEFEDVGLDMYTLGKKVVTKIGWGPWLRRKLCLEPTGVISFTSGDFPGGPVAKPQAPNAGGLGSIPGQGTRFHIPQLRVRML